MSLEENIRKFYSEECIEMILKCGDELKKDPRLIDADALKEGYEYMGYDATEHPEGSYMEGWCNGFNAAVHHCIHHVIHAPSAQPEIIRCKDCKYAEVADKEDGQDGYTCQFHRGSIWFSGSYCSWAERRQNE